MLKFTWEQKCIWMSFSGTHFPVSTLNTKKKKIEKRKKKLHSAFKILLKKMVQCFYQLGAKTNMRRELDILCQQHSLPVRNLENQPKLLVNIIARISCISIMPEVVIFGSHAINPDSREIIWYHLLSNLNIHQHHLEAWRNTDCWTPSLRIPDAGGITQLTRILLAPGRNFPELLMVVY